MPFTVSYVQRHTGLGEHRARAVRNQMVEEGTLVDTGATYRGRHGYRVKLYRVASTSRPQVLVSVRSRSSVKPRWNPRRWWEHALFGTHDGRPPPDRRR